MKELLDLLTTDDTKNKGFIIDNKIQTTNIKNDIIPIDSDSTSDDESDESTDSDSDEKQTLTKKTKPKTVIKTTKGNSKNLKLVNNESDTDSD